jgi:hypothetical protein
LLPDCSYRIHLFGLPHLAAIAGTEGGVLPGDLVLPLRTAAARDPAALLGGGVEFASVTIHGHQHGAPLAFRADAPIVLQFRPGLDPRTLRGVATLQAEGETQVRSCALRLLSNSLEGARLEVLVGDWSGWARLTLPAEIEGLGGWPLLDSHRRLRIHRAAP